MKHSSTTPTHHGKGRTMTTVNEAYNNSVVNRLHKSAWVQAGTTVTAKRVLLVPAAAVNV